MSKLRVDALGTTDDTVSINVKDIIPNVYGSRTITSKLGDSVSVKDYGAVGDGVTNDNAAILAAEAAVGANGGTLRFPNALGYNNSPLNSNGKVLREYDGPSTPINAYGYSDNFGNAAKAFKYSDGTNHVGKAGYTLFVESRPKGSGDPTVPGSDFGLGVSIIKQDWTSSQVMGQACAVDVVTRNGHFQNPVSITAISKSNPAVVTTATTHGFLNGDIIILQHVTGMFQIEDIAKFTIAGVTSNTFQLVGINSTSFATYAGGGVAHKQVGDPFLFSPGDTAGYVSNSVQSSASNFSAILEGVAYYMPNGDQIYGTKGIRVQLGAIKKSEQLAIGVLAVAENGACGAAFQAQNSRPSGLEGSWEKAFSYFADLGSGGYEAFMINQLGNIVLHGGPGATTPKKTIRANATNGSFEIVNNAGTSALFTVNDTGSVNIANGGVLAINNQQVIGPRIGGYGVTGTISRGVFNIATADLNATKAFLGAVITDLMTHGALGA